MTEDKNQELVQFHHKCFQEFSTVLNQAGYVTAEPLMLPVLDQIGDYIVRTFLTDEMYQSMFGQDVLQYFYIINTFCLEAGALFGEKAAAVGKDAPLEDIDAAIREIPDEYFEALVEGDVVEWCEKLMAEKFNLPTEADANAAIYTPVYRKWIEINQADRKSVV